MTAKLSLGYKVVTTPIPVISIYLDSQVTMFKVYNSFYNGKSRHSLLYEYVRQLIVVYYH